MRLSLPRGVLYLHEGPQNLEGGNCGWPWWSVYRYGTKLQSPVLPLNHLPKMDLQEDVSNLLFQQFVDGGFVSNEFWLGTQRLVVVSDHLSTCLSQLACLNLISSNKQGRHIL
jgi:hypothetical protein